VNNVIVVVVIGSVAGIFGGFSGIAGGVIIVPALIFLLGMPTKAAIDTSLGALLPPVGIFGAWVYWRDGSLDVRFAALLALGLAGGAYFGALIATHLSGALLRRLFALLLVCIAIRLFLPK
jgi:uncharacterized protein